MAKKVEFHTDEEFLAGIQKYLELRTTIKTAAPEMLANSNDPEQLLNELIHPSEELYQLNVGLRNFIGDNTKVCIGQDGSIADQAVQRRKELFAKKTESKEAEKAAK